MFYELLRMSANFFFGFCLVLLVPTAVSFYYEFYGAAEHPQPHVTLAFLETIGIVFFLGAICYYLGKRGKGYFYKREGIAFVVLIWFITPYLGSLPFTLSGTLNSHLQAYFESVSGFTTTGSTILYPKAYNAEGQETKVQKTIPNVIDTHYEFYGTVTPVRNQEGEIILEGVEAVPKALLFWRSFMQWLGGGGVVVLFIAILPALGVGGKVLYQSEVPGPVKEGISPRIKETAIQLWKIYLILTVIQIGALFVFDNNLDWLDASTITFSTISTGGFSVNNLSIAGYNSPSVEWIVIIFMVLGSLNFSLYFYAFRGKLYKLNDPEFLLHILFILLFAFVISYSILGANEITLQNKSGGTYSTIDALRVGFFQSVSAQTSTGFTTTNYDYWPFLPQILLLISMYVGGMSGSTAGGIKTARIFMIFRIAQNKIESIFRPETLRTLRIGGRDVEPSAAATTLVFFSIVIAVSTLGVIIYVWDGVDPETSLSLVACMVNNTGMTFRAASPVDSCAFLSDIGLWLSTILMLLGRLEYFAVLALLVPAFWKESV